MRLIAILSFVLLPHWAFGFGQIVAWGYGATVPVSASNVIAISSGYYQQGTHLALRADGTIVSWNSSGLVPTVNGLSNVTEIAAGYYQGGLALKNNGTVVGWGNGNLAPLSTLSNIVSMVMYDPGSTYLRADGSVARITFSGLEDVPGLTNIVSLFPFNYGYVALRADGTYFVNSEGWLNASPSNNVMTLAAGGYRAGQGLLLRRDGSLVGWGSPTNSPPAGTNFQGVAASMYGKFVLHANGTVSGWSSEFNLTNFPSGLTNIIAINAGEGSMLALRMSRTSAPVQLSDALNTSALVVSSRGSSQWYSQTNSTHDGLYAARSGAIGNGTASSMRLWTNGPVSVSFWWRTSSETNKDILTFSAGGIALTNLSGESGWQQCTVVTPPGNQLLQWTYSKDNSGSAGTDAAWVDQVVISHALPQPPVVSLIQSNAFVIISWPDTAAGFLLEESTNLSLSNGWSTVPQNRDTNDGKISVTLPTIDTNNFYRLRDP